MSQMTMEQIVKIIIAVFVFILVLTGVIIGFRNYIIPYFTDLGPGQEKEDFSSPHYQTLLKEESLIGVLSKEGNKNFIMLKSGSSFVKTKYYFWKESGEIYENIEGGTLTFWTWRNDKKVGEFNSAGVITLDMSASEILSIQGATKIGNELRKI